MLAGHGAGTRSGDPCGSRRDGDAVRALWTVACAATGAAPAEDETNNDAKVTSPAASQALPPVPALTPRRSRHTSRPTW